MLIRIDGERSEDRYFVVADDAALGDGSVIVSVARALRDRDQLVSRPALFGVTLPNTIVCDVISPLLDDVSLLAIQFPSFSDGRGFSLARRLRLIGFSGVLRAVGPLIPDQIRHARAVGFDEILLPETTAERQSIEDWRRAAAIISHAYQDGYCGTTILERRRKALSEVKP